VLATSDPLRSKEWMTVTASARDGHDRAAAAAVCVRQRIESARSRSQCVRLLHTLDRMRLPIVGLLDAICRGRPCSAAPTAARLPSVGAG